MVLIPLLVLALLETAARLRDPADPRFPSGLAVFQPIGGLDEREVVEIIEGDADLFWKMRPSVRARRWLPPLWVDTRSNSLGLRDHEFPLARSPEEFRILCLGDSCTYGSGVGLADAYPQQLEATLSILDRSRAFEVVNAGFPGYTVFQGFQFYRTRGVQLEAQLVLISFGFNENGYWSGLSDVETHRRLNPPGLNLLFRSALLRWLASLFVQPIEVDRSGRGAASGAAAKTTEPARRMAPNLYGEYLERLVEEVRAQSAEAVLILHPTRAYEETPQSVPQQNLPKNFDLQRFQLSQEHIAGIRQTLREVADRCQVTLLDLEHAFDDHPEYFVDNCHLTRQGCKQQALALFQLLQKSKLLPAPLKTDP
jgi:lysophospholipase L1-like esterase